MPDYIADTSFGETIHATLNAFHRALTRRWREEVCDSVLRGYEISEGHGFPTGYRAGSEGYQAGSSYLQAKRDGQIWDYRHPAARAHLSPNGESCAYVRWVRDGQKSVLSSVVCDGLTGARDGGEEALYAATGELVVVPPHVECGVGAILQEVEEWAWQERMIVASKVPLFDHHDVAALERAHHALLEIGWSLGLNYGGPDTDATGGDSGQEPTTEESQAPFRPATEGDITTLVEYIQRRDDNLGWWEAWTSLAAKAAKDNFFSSPRPTIINQAGIAGCLANLCTLRSAIIEKGRNDTLYWLQWAVDSLDSTETELVTVHHAPGWKRLRDAGMSITTLGGWIPGAVKVGAAVTVLGFLGDVLDSDIQVEQRANSVSDAVVTLNQRIDELNDTLAGMEDEYSTVASSVRELIYGIHSFNLELYDLTQNTSTLDGSGQSGPLPTERVEIDGVLRIAEACYSLGDAYNELLPMISKTTDAIPSLAGTNGTVTEADRKTREVCELLEGFLKTTCARYLLAADHVHDTARDYIEVDESQQQRFVEMTSAWGNSEIGQYEVEFEIGDRAEATERPAGAGTEDHNYLTEESQDARR